MYLSKRTAGSEASSCGHIRDEAGPFAGLIPCKA